MVVKSQEQEPGRIQAMVEARSEGDDWSWMVDEDPAFVLEGCDGA